MNRREMIAALAALTTTGVTAAQESTSPESEVPASRTGPGNLITDVEGLQVGQSQNESIRTGVTVILPDEAAVAACDVRGGGPASRETDVLKPENLVQVVDGIVLSGGSVYGLASADGVAAWMGARNRGFSFRPTPGIPPSPILPTACLYDLANGGDKAWGESPPYRDLGVEAIESVGKEFALGTAGAGYGANSGGLKGGLGSASAVSADGITVGAITGVNSMGSAIAPGGKQFWAAPFEIGDEFGGLGTSGLAAGPEDYSPAMQPRTNTTLACIATDVALSRVELQRIAIMANDGMARALRPSHGPFDGDIVFALSTGRKEAAAGIPRQFLVTRLGALAADVLARAIARAIYEATPFAEGGNPAWRDL
ncbi:MAG: P1 family peptidase [Gammaproteobacteria bacterium]|nr:P1 family peptidase [Gammaproteobacteria bacterium]